MYMFQGISLVTQNYINPAIDTIKKKGIVSNHFHFLLTDPYFAICNFLAWFRHDECHFTGLL